MQLSMLLMCLAAGLVVTLAVAVILAGLVWLLTDWLESPPGEFRPPDVSHSGNATMNAAILGDALDIPGWPIDLL